ncbi:MAG TPA: SRPBCC domain-containing protein [Polyangiaceae bacterium]|jgi:uncharacterized protein YndB with AHSA1/START domain
MSDERDVSLVLRRLVRASPARVFEAWTRPDELARWWGPNGVTCVGAEVDLRVGGGYRIGNQLPDGKVLWIVGVFELIEAPHKLVYSWRLEPGPDTRERVTVQFEPRAGGTEVVVTHERIANAPLRDQHEQGWHGCLDGLARLLGD